MANGSTSSPWDAKNTLLSELRTSMENCEENFLKRARPYLISIETYEHLKNYFQVISAGSWAALCPPTECVIYFWKLQLVTMNSN